MKNLKIVTIFPPRPNGTFYRVMKQGSATATACMKLPMHLSHDQLLEEATKLFPGFTIAFDAAVR